MGSARTAGVIAGLLALAAPAGALGASASVASDERTGVWTLTYAADAGEVNDVRVAPRPSNLIRIDDPGAALVLGDSHCTTEPFGTTCSTGIGIAGALPVPVGDPPAPIDGSNFALGSGNDQLSAAAPLFVFAAGDAGDDTLVAQGTGAFSGGPGADFMAGGPGDRDRAYYLNPDVGVRVTLDGVANDGAPGEGDNVMPSIEWLVGTRVDDVLIGNGADNVFEGFGGVDHLKGAGGDDSLSGTGRFEGGPGDDNLGFWGSGPTVQTPPATAIGGAGNDEISVRATTGTVNAGPGDDTVFASGSPQLGVTISCGPGIDIVHADAPDTVASDCETVLP